MMSTAPLYSEKATGYFARPRSDIKDLLPENTSRVLELGCGNGATMRWLRSIRHVDHASGVELVDDAACIAKATFDEILVGDIETMLVGLAPQSFDLVIALDVLEHLIDPWRVVGLCQKVLKPNGCMISSIPNIGHYSVALPLLFFGHWSYQTEGLLDRSHLRFFSGSTAASLMTDSGFVIEQTERVRVVPDILVRIPDWLGGPRLRWYALKLLNWLPGRHLMDYQYLIRARTTG